MKRSEFKQLKPGDEITIRTMDELLGLRGVDKDQDGDIVIVDGLHKCLFPRDMFRFCGQKYIVNAVDDDLRLRCKGTMAYTITRKMLRPAGPIDIK